MIIFIMHTTLTCLNHPYHAHSTDLSQSSLSCTQHWPASIILIMHTALTCLNHPYHAHNTDLSQSSLSCTQHWPVSIILITHRTLTCLNHPYHAQNTDLPQSSLLRTQHWPVLIVLITHTALTCLNLSRSDFKACCTGMFSSSHMLPGCEPDQPPTHNQSAVQRGTAPPYLQESNQKYKPAVCTQFLPPSATNWCLKGTKLWKWMLLVSLMTWTRSACVAKASNESRKYPNSSLAKKESTWLHLD